ncbi:Nischarin [Blattella germanica]|nr:Nischarin [Blattella germanica]
MNYSTATTTAVYSVILDHLTSQRKSIIAMACFLINRHDTEIKIPTVEKHDNVTVYVIKVRIGNVTWTVPHRYSDFVELHEKLVSDHGVAKDILPPKKVIGNREPAFIEKRRSALEIYLASLLHAISERLKQPCPPLEILDNRYDFSHVLDFCCQLTCITIVGSNSPIGTSNIVPNNLNFELSAFKAVQKLNLIGFPVSNIFSIGLLRNTVSSLNVHHAELKKITHVLLCDDLHKNVNYAGDSHSWKNIIEANFSDNALESIDEGVKLLPNIEHLTLNNNKISALTNLTSLPHLSHLNLSANCFIEANDFQTKLGNIRFIDLSQNSITSLKGFSKLYSLESLDLASNQVSELSEIKHISSLPCLENLILTGNPVAIVVDYRVRALEQFGNRASEICLDNEKPSQKELDTVAVLQAIRIVKEGRTPTFGPEAPTFP